ncbi:hypothetical protein [Helicobacter sp. 12S02232-10]|nr:hypothetical protein [Helicobacter sp. 12S02232-10]
MQGRVFEYKIRDEEDNEIESLCDFYGAWALESHLKKEYQLDVFIYE